MLEHIFERTSLLSPSFDVFNIKTNCGNIFQLNAEKKQPIRKEKKTCLGKIRH